MDEMVLEVQEWVNLTYGGRYGYNPAPIDGKTGWSTMYALTRALQIELGISQPSDNFGNGTKTAYKAWGEMEIGKVPTDQKGQNIVKILQGACYCKGYNPTGFTGSFGEGTKAAVIQLQTDAGLPVRNGKVYDYIFKSFLTMDAYVLIAGGDPRIRQMQQDLNFNYYMTAGVQPCDGYYQRGTNQALIYGIQTEEGILPASQTGSVGPTTKSLLPTLSEGSIGNFVKLFQYALYVNGFDSGMFDGVYTNEVKNTVMDFQKFCMLNVDGVAGKQTWLSALISTGDSSRKGTACDCATTITPAKAASLKAAGYQTVGRYLTNASPDSQLNKKIQPGELQTIFNAGLTVFPIYQTYGDYVGYFTRDQGRRDADAAHNAAREHGFLKGTTIYFAVDFDVFGYQITENIIPYFVGVHERMINLGEVYNIGVYGPRAVGIEVSKQGLAKTSFVSGMSTGYSGNLGYPLPSNWAFDQISTITVGSGDGAISIDNDIKSGKYDGESAVDTSVQYSAESLNREFYKQIDQIYELAFSYSRNDVIYANHLVCQYLRAKVYNGELWGVIAGPLDSDFIELVDEQIPYMYELYDSKNKMALDVPHLTASLDSILYFFGATDGYKADFSGWAGDLITVTGDAVSEGNVSVYDAAMALIGNTMRGSFTLVDLLADVDAFNIGYILERMVQPINDLIKYYYQDIFDHRFSLFYENRFSGDPDQVVAECLKILTPTDPLVLLMLKTFMNHFGVPDFSDEQAAEVTRAFKDTLLNKLNEE